MRPASLKSWALSNALKGGCGGGVSLLEDTYTVLSCHSPVATSCEGTSSGLLEAFSGASMQDDNTRELRAPFLATMPRLNLPTKGTNWAGKG